jgi:hypothetical protein
MTAYVNLPEVECIAYTFARYKKIPGGDFCDKCPNLETCDGLLDTYTIGELCRVYSDYLE